MNIGIVGAGVVGGATAVAMRHLGHSVRLYDPAKGHEDDLSDAEVAFICVNSTDTSHANLWAAAAWTATHAPNALIAVRTTSLPGTTDALSKAYGRVVYVPEFLREATANEDALNPDKLVIGARNTWADPVLEAFEGLVPEERIHLTGPVEAELAKLALNSLLLLKVVYANEVYDVCREYGADPDALLRVFDLHQDVNARHLAPSCGGMRWAGGKCLPKDTAFFLHAAGDLAPVIALAERKNREGLEGE